jgi:hypothetical protein
MNNSDMPAMPLTDAEQWWDPAKPELGTYYANGLTKREHFAGLAMQSLILAIPAWEALNYGCPDHAQTVRESYKYADLMTAELDKVES